MAASLLLHRCRPRMAKLAVTDKTAHTLPNLRKAGTMRSKKQEYLVGERVHVSKGSLSGPVTMEEFEIVGRYTVEGHQPMYRLHSVQGAAERMVPQNEIRVSH